MSIHLLVLEMRKMLHNLDGCLDKAVAHATAKKFDADTLLVARLAPDMFALLRQIQIGCDHAKWAASRSAGKDAPSFPDDEKTIADAKKRIASTIAFLDTFKADDFAKADSVKISLPRWEGKSMTGTEYVIEYALPNFFFHVTTAYAILRHNGVEIGKRDYVGATPMK
jgi:hypothetical protein